ncbi:acyl-CoA dehydrogenase family protein [Streptomyces sp. 24-1644]|uniref:acyl-CoA dehydrogenase family protein n=1 Tax=unclassified Streptomyces TaxID=2593676 RepID=UPI00365C1472
MDLTSTPARTELVERASKLRPLLQSHAAWTEENRRLHEESVEAMAEAGIFRMRVPARYGGYESDARTLVDVAAELARGDGSAAWTASVWWIPTWMAGLFPDHVQDEVFSRPDVRVSGTLSPGGMAAPADGGVVVNGKWGFISGAWHSHWQVLIAVSPTPDGGMQPVMALVPTDQLQIVDDWYTSGLRGSGSVTTIASDVFVPQERVLPLGAVLQQQYASELNAGSPMFRAPMLAVASASSVGTMTGLAAAAQDAFRSRLAGRKITYTDYEEQSAAPITHLQLGEATLLADEARFQAHRLAGLVDSKGASGEAWTLEERALCRGLLGRACRLGKESVDILASASGGSSIYNDVPIQRVQRDAQSITLHALMNPGTNLELYGRVLCGQGPNTLYV